MSLQASKRRVIWIDLLRVFATCLVPMAHLCSNLLNNTEGVYSPDYIAMNFFNSMCRWVVPVFVMISGVFFLHPGKECDPKKIFRKNILRMLTAFAFWSLIYALQQSFLPAIAYGKEVAEFSWETFLNDFITGEYHMWYLYMIAGLYLVTPLIKVFTDNATKKQLEVFMVISFVFTNLLPMILALPAVKALDFASVNDYINIGYVSGYTGLYVGGYYMMRYPFRKRVRLFIYAMGIAGYVIMSCGNLWLSFELNEPTKDLLAANHASSVMIAYAMFTFFQHVISKVRFSHKQVEIIKWLSARSFGVFLCHVLIMRVFQYFGIQAIHFNPTVAKLDLSALPYIHVPAGIGVPVLTILVLIGSFALSWGISKIPVLKKYVL
ncbi:MAG: acyltransferase family protein [Clostridia bacterium]|nr:acyltransferase family protein [Clostridia bacterium]